MVLTDIWLTYICFNYHICLFVNVIVLWTHWLTIETSINIFWLNTLLLTSIWPTLVLYTYCCICFAIFLCIYFLGGSGIFSVDILENSTTAMSAGRTCHEERTLRITLEFFMKDDFTKCGGCGKNSWGGETLEITWNCSWRVLSADVMNVGRTSGVGRTLGDT